MPEGITDQCQSCGDEVGEWQINAFGLCQDCDLDRQGFFDDDDDAMEHQSLFTH